MKKIIFLLLVSIQAFSQGKDTLIIFSEIMFNNRTSIPNGEFIELFNTSFTDTIDVAGWKINYYTSNPDLIVDAGMGTKILPRQYAVIFENDYAGGYNLPLNALILKINDNAFGTSGMANTTDRDLNLINQVNQHIWTYIYSANNSSGYSDEKIFMIGDNSPSNWANSIVLNGTPGKSNSVAVKEYDLWVVNILTDPLFPIANDSVRIKAVVKNSGIRLASNFEVIFKYDYNNDNTFDVVLEKTITQSIPVGDSLIVESDSLIRNLVNQVLVFCEINYSLDENRSNDTLTAYIKPGIASGSVLISEIIFTPRSGEPEWVELYNNSNSTINLKNWKISDVLSTPTKVTITTSDLFLEPNKYIVLASNISIINFYDSIPSQIQIVNIPSLNNDKDGVVIYDDRGLVIDSVFYFSDWGLTNKSIERISFSLPSNDRNNWVASVADSGGTPGRQNSVLNIKSYNFQDVVINEIMYEPLKGFPEYVEIFNNSNDSINLAGWKIIEGGENSFLLSSRSFYLNPGEFFLLVSDSSIFNQFPYLNEVRSYSFIKITGTSNLSLSNSGDLILLKDVFNKTIDSVNYALDWHNPDIESYKGRSLERISPLLNSNDPRNWSTSVDKIGGTPIRQNSIYLKKIKSQTKLDISPNPFSPDQDGFEDHTIITYQLPVETAQIRVRIFDSIGRLVRVLADNEPAGSTGSIIFDGLDDNHQPLRIGIYIVLLEAINQQNGVVETIKRPVVIAKKLK